jgi:23S rRNA pseudouridine2457 synthase
LHEIRFSHRFVQGATLPFHYLKLFKPYDVLSQFSDAGGRTTLKAYVPIEGVYPVGRLDRDSEGLLFLTDDGWMAHCLTDPRFAHPKTYLVQVERIPDNAALERLRRGIELNDGQTRPAEVELLSEPPTLPERSMPIRFRKAVPTAWLRLTICEGRNRQVRRMTAAVGHPTLRLVRVAIGSVQLGDLAPGQWRELTNAERMALQRIQGRGTQAPRRPRCRHKPQNRRSHRA